jgi:hypothetical protein
MKLCVPLLPNVPLLSSQLLIAAIVRYLGSHRVEKAGAPTLEIGVEERGEASPQALYSA